jgi:D-alanyl-D-alanine carboxypeptidase
MVTGNGGRVAGDPNPRWMIEREEGVSMLGRLAIVLVALVVSISSAPAVANTKYAAVVMDYATGEVLHSRRADVALLPASLTKMMTLMMLFDALERGELKAGSKLPVSRRAAGMPASKLGLRAGSTITVDQAIQAMTVRSANDVAVVIAEALAGSESAFAEQMTRRARAIGMRSTTFMNASGLPNSRQKSTARDMAILSHRLIRHYAQYYHYFSQPSFSFAGRTYRSHNNLVRSYRGMDGLKTGYTRASGFNLASSAVREGRRVIVVVFGGRSARSRDAEVVRLMDLGFERLRQRRPDPIIAALPKPRPGTVMAEPATAAAVAAAALPEPRPAAASAAEPEAARTSVLDALPAAEREAILAAVRDTPLPAPNPNTSSPAAVELGSGLIAGAAKAPARGDYAVQVGAYHDPELARRAAHLATELLPQILLLGDIDISPLQGRRQLVYRARVAGFDQALAARACDLLQAKRQECFVVRTGPRQLAPGGTS